MPPSRALRRSIVLFAFAAAAGLRAQERVGAAGQAADGEGNTAAEKAAPDKGAPENPAAGETIEVAGERSGASPKAPAAQATVIDAAQFAGEVRSVSELLLSSPGATVHALGGPGQTVTLSLRGATADESLILLDGIPLQGPGGGAIDLATLPAVLLDRMIVSRGVLGAQYGAGALGGAVELIPRGARGTSTAGAQAAFGSFGTAQIAADAAVPLGARSSALLAVQGDRTAGDFEYARQLASGGDTYGFTRQNADALRGSALARAALPIGDDELDVIAQGSAGDRGLPGPWTAPTLHVRQIDSGELLGLRLRGAGGNLGWSARAWGQTNFISLRGAQIFAECQDGAPGCPRNDQRTSAARGEGEVSFLAGSHTLGAVANGGEEWARGSQIAPHRRTVAALALSDEWTPFSGGVPQLSLHGAARLDHVGDETGPSAALGALWTTGPFQLRAGWGASFRAPTFSELYLHGGGIGSNPDLRPERAWSLDAGVAWRAHALTISAGAFFSRYRDLVIYVLHDRANEVTPQNVGSAHIAGVELQAVVPLPGQFLAEAAYSSLVAINDRPGATESRELAYRPPHRLFLRLARRGDRVEGYAEASFTSRMPRNPYGTAFLPSQFVTSAGAGARVAGPLWIDVEAKNLLGDETLEDLFQYPLPGLSIAVIARARL